MTVQQVSPVVCVNCRTQFTAPIQNIVDGQDPALKRAVLQGQLNVVRCPQCGSVNSPTIPILYYDLLKELAFVLFPSELHLVGAEQEKMIGKLTNTLINSLPTEQRKFYLFNPKLFLSYESLVKAILEADGITEEVLQSQMAAAKLIEEFLNCPDEDSLIEKIKANEAKLDYDFFKILTIYMQTAQMADDQAKAQTLFALRNLLEQMSRQGQAAIAKVDADLGLVIIQSHEQLLQKLQQANSQEERETLVAAGHGLLDYSFFQKLTSKIDQAQTNGQTKEVETLKKLRADILNIKAKQEEESRVVLEKATKLLQEIVQSQQPDQVLAAKLNEIDEAFFFVLNANIEEARRHKQEKPAQALELIGQMAMGMLQERYAADMPEDQPDPEKPQIFTATR